MSQLLHEEASPFLKALTANSTDAAYPGLLATLTEPSTGVVTLSVIPGGVVPQALLVMPYVLGANNDTFSVRVNGWSKSAGGLWVPAILAEYDCVGGADANCLGVTGGDVGATERFADTLTIVANMGTNAEGTFKVSPQNDTPAHFIVNVRGFTKVQLQFKKGSGTSANALLRGF